MCAQSRVYEKARRGRRLIFRLILAPPVIGYPRFRVLRVFASRPTLEPSAPVNLYYHQQ